MALLTMREALNQAMREEMTRDPNVFILGEEVGAYQGAYKITQGLLAKFGEWRVRDTPIAEEAIAGIAVGAAFIGLRPIAEMMTFNFSLLALDHDRQPRGQVPLHVRRPDPLPDGDARARRAPRRRWRPSTRRRSRAGTRNVPGLVVVMPSTPKDAKGLLKSAIRDDNPVIFMENEVLYNLKGEVPDEEYHIPLGLSDVKREGKDVTLVAWSRSVRHRAGGRRSCWPRRASRPRSSTRARCARSTTSRSSTSVRKTEPLRGRRGGLAHGRLRRRDRGPRAARVLRRARRAGPARDLGRRADAVREDAREGVPAAAREGRRRRCTRSSTGTLRNRKEIDAVTKVVLAKLSPTMEEGTIVKWSKNEGDPVKVGRRARRDRDRQGQHGDGGARRAACCARSWCPRAARRRSAR